ncbi:MAG TPA: FG-GAP repeat protein [Polyangia bacterium]
MRFSKTILLAAFALDAALTGCNPSDFNSILDKAPVLDLGIPGSSTGALFVLPLPAPDQTTKVAARMLVSRKDSNYLALADYDMNGKATLHEASAVETSLGYPVYSAAVRSTDGLVILGTPKYAGGTTPAGRVSTLTIGSKPDGSPTFAVQNGISGQRMGISVATGNITGPLTGDFVAVSDNSVQLLGTDPAVPIASPPAFCPALQLGSQTDFYAFRPVVVADLLAGAFDEIVLGGQGQVLFVQYDGTAVLPCPTKVLTLASVSSFGTSLAAGDFDGDGHMDLAVGAPPNHVYVYFGPLDTATTYDVDIAGASVTQFGKQIATYHLPGQASAQLLVADPAAASRGAVGEVMLFNITRGTRTILTGDAVVTLFDSNKDSDPGLFGLNLGGVEFNAGLCGPTGTKQLVPWASLGPNILTFFAYGGAPLPDPRCFAH